MTRASIETLESLHAKVAAELSRKIESGEATAADLNVARQFLNDNGIEATAVPAAPFVAFAAAVQVAPEDLPFPVSGTKQ